MKHLGFRLGSSRSKQPVKLIRYNSIAPTTGAFEPSSSALPMTQLQLGEALGLSLVHVNRTMQQLRRDRLIELKPGRVRILDRKRLSCCPISEDPSCRQSRGLWIQAV
jgi:CRP-like cAMP-binding protein